jgi:CxxC-x17-CxxC domain-containing protein
LKSENVTGDHIHSSKNCENCFDGHGNEDCFDAISLADSKDVGHSYSAGWPGCELIFNSAVSRGSTNLVCCYYSWFCENLQYCDSCSNSKDCFGCIGLKHAQYCVLNKQYSKEEYFRLREKIIKHMKTTGEYGKFFPIKDSAFAYNESVAGEYFPLTEKEILAKNWRYREEKQNFKYDGPKYEIPAKIEDVPDDIVDKILTCEATGKYYKIQKAELEFYRKMNLPIPRLCPDERHKRRMALRNPRQLFSRECAECGKDIQTTFAPDRPEKVLCEKCYLNEVN